MMMLFKIPLMDTFSYSLHFCFAVISPVWLHTTLFNNYRSLCRASLAVVFFQMLCFNGDNLRKRTVTACKVRLMWMRGTTPISRLAVSLMTISTIVQPSLEPKNLKGLPQQAAGGRWKNCPHTHEIFPVEKDWSLGNEIYNRILQMEEFIDQITRPMLRMAGRGVCKIIAVFFNWVHIQTWPELNPHESIYLKTPAFRKESRVITCTD